MVPNGIFDDQRKLFGATRPLNIVVVVDVLPLMHAYIPILMVLCTRSEVSGCVVVR